MFRRSRMNIPLPTIKDGPGGDLHIIGRVRDAPASRSSKFRGSDARI
jgi:hypothetical protein